MSNPGNKVSQPVTMLKNDFKMQTKYVWSSRRILVGGLEPYQSDLFSFQLQKDLHVFSLTALSASAFVFEG